MALDGLERILRKKYPHSGPKALKGMNKQVNLVRYCDDFLITGISKEVLEQEVKPLVTDFLCERVAYLLVAGNIQASPPSRLRRLNQPVRSL
jgi:hypothetical protein